MSSSRFRHQLSSLGLVTLCALFGLAGCGNSGSSDSQRLSGLQGASIVGPGSGMPGPGNGDPVPFGPALPPYGRLLSTPDGTIPGNAPSQYASISSSGRYAVFESEASNLVPGDTNGVSDIFLLDTSTNQLRIVSRRSDGSPSSGASVEAQVNRNGTVVCFSSTDALLPEDTNSYQDVYAFNIASGTLELVSKSSTGTVGDEDSRSSAGAVSPDGRYVVFQSRATNLVPGDTNGQDDVFVRDLQLGTTERISIAPGGVQGTSQSFALSTISNDGRYVTFWSDAAEFLPSGVSDTNGTFEVYLRDRTSDTLTLVSRSASGTSTIDGFTNIATWMSPDGSSLLVSSTGTNLISPSVASGGVSQIYRYTVATNSFQLLTTDGTGNPSIQRCFEGSLSADGRYLVYVRERDTSTPTSPLEAEYEVIGQVVVRDLTTSQERLVSGTTSGAESNGYAYFKAFGFRPDGQEIVFSSDATNLAAQAVNTLENQVYSRRNPFLD